MKLALVTGVTGQDGSYLAELLLEKNYMVWGMMRTSSNHYFERIDHILKHPNFKSKRGDMRDTYSIQTIFEEIATLADIERVEVYNLAAQSHVRHSFDIPEYTADVDALGVLRILECIRRSPCKDKIRFYQASTSELYGNRLGPGINILNEAVGFEPCSPYAVSKLFAYWSVRNYREGYGLYACNGVLFNHESPRRGADFVTRKITLGVAKIKKGEQELIELGNMDSRRDWGHARDYVEGMWRMLQQNKPEDIVLATGEHYSVREFVEAAFNAASMPLTWSGEGVHEIGTDSTGVVRLKINPEFFRPNELHVLIGDSKKAFEVLGWKPTTTFVGLVKEMVDADCK